MDIVAEGVTKIVWDKQTSQVTLDSHPCKRFSQGLNQRRKQFPFKTSKTILNKTKITMIQCTGNAAITYIPKTAMHSYLDSVMLNVLGLFMINYDSSTSEDFI
jgi:hypothetical protein